MSIDIQLLKSKGALCKHYQKHEIIFYENEPSNYYYQIVQGAVKMFNANMDGKQYLQGIFSAGNSFGEPPLLVQVNYPSTASAMVHSEIIRLPKEDFLELLEKNPMLQMNLLKLFAHRLYNKSITASEIINHTPESRIVSFMDAFKRKQETTDKIEIPFTRQLIADFTGLRVETVIRTLAKMKEAQKIDIINRKVIY